MRSRHRGFLVTALFGALLSGAYLLGHSSPTLGGGLFLDVASQIARTGSYPWALSGYGPEPIPFAYPPGGFLLVAGFLAAGIDGVTLATYLPALLFVAVPVVAFLSADYLLPQPYSVLAAVFVGASPHLLQWHQSAGGLIRTPALLLTLLGIYTALGLFDAGERRWLVSTTLLFGLVVLTHPVYAVIFGLNTLVLAFRDGPSAAKIARGALVAVGGFALSSPFWAAVLAHHPPAVLLDAAGTRGGVLSVGAALRFAVIDHGLLVPVGIVLAGVGALYLALSGRYALAGWFGVAVLFGQSVPEFEVVPGAIVAAVFLHETIDIDRRFSGISGEQVFVAAVAAFVTLNAVVFAAGNPVGDSVGDTADKYETYLSDYDREALSWLRSHSEAGASVLAVGDVNEWVPYVSDRRTVYSTRGVEWLGPQAIATNERFRRRTLGCPTVECLVRNATEDDRVPDYVYVGRDDVNDGSITRFGDDPQIVEGYRIRLRYENDRVAILDVAPPTNGSARQPPVGSS